MRHSPACASAIAEDGARLDIAAYVFLDGRFERAFFDVRVFNPHAPLNRRPLSYCYRNTKTSRNRPMNRETGKSSTAPSLPSSCPSLVGWETPPPSATRGSPPCSLPNGNSPTAIIWPGSDAACHSLFFARQSSTYAHSAGGRVSKQLIPSFDLVSTEAKVSSSIFSLFLNPLLSCSLCTG